MEKKKVDFIGEGALDSTNCKDTSVVEEPKYGYGSKLQAGKYYVQYVNKTNSPDKIDNKEMNWLRNNEDIGLTLGEKDEALEITVEIIADGLDWSGRPKHASIMTYSKANAPEVPYKICNSSEMGLYGTSDTSQTAVQFMYVIPGSGTSDFSPGKAPSAKSPSNDWQFWGVITVNSETETPYLNYASPGSSSEYARGLILYPDMGSGLIFWNKKPA